MRRAIGPVLLILGVVLVLLGGVASLVVGPDDTVDVAGEEMSAAAGIPVVTAPALTAVSGVDLVVEAEAPGGVFVGAAHRVDIDDLVEDVHHVRVTGLRPGRVVESTRGGGRFLRGTRASVDELDVWREQAAGRGRQQITVPLTETPVGVLVLPSAEDSPTVAFGYRVAGLFALCLGVTVLGLSLLAIWVVRRMRRRRAGSPHGGISADAVGTAGTDGAVGTSTRRPTPVARAAGTTAVTLAGVMTVTACVPTVLAVETPRKVALESYDVEHVVVELAERRRSAAEAARHPMSNAAVWIHAVAGPWRETADFATRHDHLVKEKSPPPTALEAGGRVWAPAFDSYPMWALAEVSGLDAPLAASAEKAQRRRDTQRRRKAAGGGKPATADSEPTGLTLLTREAAAQPWRAFAGVRVDPGALPAPLTGAPAPEPSTAVVRQAEKAVNHFMRWWRTGRKGGLKIDAETRRVRRNVATFTFDGEKHRALLDFRKWSKPEEGLRIVETRAGHLALSTVRLRATLHVPGHDLVWSGEASRTLKGSNEHGPHTEAALVSAFHLRQDGSAEVLGSDLLTLIG